MILTALSFSLPLTFIAPLQLVHPTHPSPYMPGHHSNHLPHNILILPPFCIFLIMITKSSTTRYGHHHALPPSFLHSMDPAYPSRKYPPAPWLDEVGWEKGEEIGGYPPIEGGGWGWEG